jgi:hypothetical protein
MTAHDAPLDEWLALAEEVARRHRQGQVLGTDPALVLRGLPPMWRPAATSPGGPADDVVGLAGAALARVGADDVTLRPPLVEAAAGCLGSDLPALLRAVRPALAEALAARSGDEAPGDDARRMGGPDDHPSPGRRPRVGPRSGRRLALVGGLGAAALAVLGVAGSWSTPTETRTGIETRTESETAAPSPAILSARPTPVAGDDDTWLAWRPPHLVVEAGGTRYRYRLEGRVDTVALAAGIGPAAVVVTAGEDRWEVAVPALDATEPGRTGSG